MYFRRPPFPPSLPLAPRAHALSNSIPPRKSRARAVVRTAGVPPLMAVRAPMPNIPTEIGLEIIQLALIATPPSILSAVSKKFNALVCKIIYDTVTLDGLARIALFHRTLSSKSPDFWDTHVRVLAVTCQSYSAKARVQLEEIVAACTMLQTVAIPRPAILTSPAISATRPSQLIIQKFDAMTPFEWDPLFAEAVASPAADLAQNVTHLRICEPGAVWHSPLATLEFFGALANLTHLALARHVNPQGNPNDAAFISEVRAVLETRPGLKMLAVHLYPWRWPDVTRAATNLCSYGCLCKGLLRVADKRLVLLATGWETLFMDKSERELHDFGWMVNPAANHGSSRLGSISFWENWRMSDKRIVSLATCWEPEFLHDAAKWTYSDLGNELRGGHSFWDNWMVPE
ncbi:hypothetical protein DFH06DRAFT_1182238 [Mycena polygramma]|nr:hypothetical protein DFH06DRAFT_1182238 [Mycena polygramma]